jgi:hypothetical protein
MSRFSDIFGHSTRRSNKRAGDMAEAATGQSREKDQAPKENAIAEITQRKWARYLYIIGVGYPALLQYPAAREPIA